MDAINRRMIAFQVTIVTTNVVFRASAPSPLGRAQRFLRMVFVALSVGPTMALAQGADIIVIGSPLRAPIGDAAYDKIIIGPDRIGASASGRIEDVLKDVAGLQQFRRSDARSANATSQGATLRGLGGNASSRALLVLDGVPQSDPFGGWVTWPAFAANRIGQIRVTRGGGAGDYGSGALAGTIELESIVSDRARSSASLFYGSRNGLEANGLVAGKLGTGFAFVSGSYARGDGFVPLVAGQRGRVDRAAPYRQVSVSARAVIPVSAATELQASALAFSDRRTRGTILSENGGDGADASIRLIHEGNWAWSALAYVQMRKFTSRFVAIDAARTVVTQATDQYNVPSTGLGARFEVRPPVGNNLELRLGADWRRTRGETRELFTYVAGLPTRGRLAGGQSETLGGFAELSGDVNRLTLTGSIRADHWRISDGHLIERTLSTGALLRNDRPADRSGWEGTGRAGLAYDAGPFTLRGAAYLGWRLPTLNELYRPFRVGPDATAANSALSPERMKGVELGFDLRPTDQLTLRSTLFSNRLTKAIANVTLGAGPGTFPGVGFVAGGGAYRQRQNVDAIQSKGIELDARWTAGDWTLQASAALTDARVRSSGLALPLNRLRPAQVPKYSASATLGWKSVSATARYVAKQFEDDLNRRGLKAALTFDATASLPLSKALALTLRAENLTNGKIQTAISATGVVERATPQTFWIGLTLK
jgi:vitamin B12 transporter